jgi:hypothetical protein
MTHRSRQDATVIIACTALLYLTVANLTYAQSYDGTYSGAIVCEPIPGVTAGLLKTLFTLRISGEKIDYEREVLRPTGEAPLGITEKGTGGLDPDGELTLTGTAKGRSFRSESRYRGKFAGNGISLSGTQIWTFLGKPTPHSRSCTIELTRSN